MPTHTFIADSANEAVQQIRTELGPSAVVLSVRKLPRNGLSRLVKKEQIEVVASLDASTGNPMGGTGVSPGEIDLASDRRARPVGRPFSAGETPAGGRRDAFPTHDPVLALQKEIEILKEQFASLQRAPQPRISSVHSDFHDVLVESGLLPVFAQEILAEVPRALRGDRKAHLDCIENILRAKWRGEPVQNEAAVHVFIGVPGSGKSTVLCKMLAQTSIVEQQTATVYQLDSHVANTSGQTSIFAEIIGARFARTLAQDFERREESDFVDLPGVALRDEKGLAVLRSIIESFGVPEVHLVLNGAYESNHLLEQVQFFANVGISDLIVSHLDEETRWGKVWNLVLGTNFSVRSLSCGQNVPGDLLVPTAETLLNRQFP
jgi:flagellar biosynthesis protein FlhF